MRDQSKQLLEHFVTFWDEELLSRTAVGTAGENQCLTAENRRKDVFDNTVLPSHPSSSLLVNLGLGLDLHSFPDTPTHCSLETGC